MAAPSSRQAPWMLLGAFMFASMGVCIKFAAAGFNTFEITAYRGLIGAVFVFAIARTRGVSLLTTQPMMHLWRSVVGTTAMVGSFYAIAHLPLATAMTLNYMSSIWVATFLIGGALLLQDRNGQMRQQGPLFLTVLAGFGGVALMLRPTLGSDQLPAALVGLLSGLFAALAYLQVSALARAGEPEARTVLYFSLGAALVGFGGMLITGASPWDWQHGLWLVPTGVTAALGQLCMTRAYSSGATLLVANLQYSGIVFGSIYSLLVFGEQLPWQGWAGMALIVASAVAATVLRSRTVPGTPAEERS